MTPLPLQRLELLVGPRTLERAGECHVALFGVGGVGSWCAESLVRSGIGHLTIVDSDRVDPTNINRQLQATTLTVGQPKVEVMRRRLLSIAPEAHITALDTYFDADTARLFDFESFDYVIDAIDSLASKALLIEMASAARRPRLYSSMGAALRLDPTRVAVATLDKVTGCPLARALRSRFKRQGRWPRRKVRCVYSTEPAMRPPRATQGGDSGEPRPNGSSVTVTAAFGLTLASLVINDIYSSCKHL